MIILVDAEKSFAQFNNFIYGFKKKNQQIKIPQSDEKKWHWMCFNEDDPIIL